MTTERVDKNWQTRDIDVYSTQAILGTLAHYGVVTSEDGFLSLANEDFPLGIAQRWHEHWKGKGQFSKFPAAAAEEMWRRLKPNEIAPTDLTLALMHLMGALSSALEKKADDGTWDTRFKVVEGLLTRVPQPPERRAQFMAEMLFALDEWREVFDGMAVALVKEGFPALADRLVVIEEQVFPGRKGTATALVKAAKGDRAGAVADWESIAGDAARDGLNRLSAIDELIAHEQFEVALRNTLAVAEAAKANADLVLLRLAIERLSDFSKAERDGVRARVLDLLKDY